MENKKQNWVLKGFSIGSIACASLFSLEHDCKIEKLIKMADAQAEIPINNDLSCNHKAFVFGAANTITPTLSGDFIDCPVDSLLNG